MGKSLRSVLREGLEECGDRGFDVIRFEDGTYSVLGEHSGNEKSNLIVGYVSLIDSVLDEYIDLNDYETYLDAFEGKTLTDRVGTLDKLEDVVETPFKVGDFVETYLGSLKG